MKCVVSWKARLRMIEANEVMTVVALWKGKMMIKEL